MDKFFPVKKQTALLVIDVQEKISAAMNPNILKNVVDNILRLLKGMEILGCFYFVTEQYSRGLDGTVEDLRSFKQKCEHLEKMTFSCCRDLPLAERLKENQVTHVILTGMETHVCVLQTALDLVREGFFVHCVRDGLISRVKSNWETGLQLMRDAGCVITSTETILFQLLEMSGTEEFKQISKLVK